METDTESYVRGNFREVVGYLKGLEEKGDIGREDAIATLRSLVRIYYSDRVQRVVLPVIRGVYEVVAENLNLDCRRVAVVLADDGSRYVVHDKIETKIEQLPKKTRGNKAVSAQRQRISAILDKRCRQIMEDIEDGMVVELDETRDMEGHPKKHTYKQLRRMVKVGKKVEKDYTRLLDGFLGDHGKQPQDN